MRRTASEVIRSLEMRVARLEKRAGFSSWKCMACGKSIISHLKWEAPEIPDIPGIPTPKQPKVWSDKSKWMSELVVIHPNGKVEIDESYDGYHNANGSKLPSGGGKTAPFSVFHKKCWELSGKPGYVGDAVYARDQGWFLRGEPRSKPKAMGEDLERRRQKRKEKAEIGKEIDSGNLSRTDALSSLAYRALESTTGVTKYTERDTMYLEGIGSRAGQFHFFVVWEDQDTGLFVGASAYGKLADPAGIKAVELARGDDLGKVESKVGSKYRAKLKKYPIEKKRFAGFEGGFVRVRSPINRPLKTRVALQRKARDKKTFKGESCRLVMDSSGRHNSLTLTEIPAQGQKTVRETQWTFGWANQYVRQISSETGGLFLVQNIMMELTKLGGPEGKDYDENVALINTAIQNHMDKNFNAMEITPERTRQTMRENVKDAIKGHESTLKASEVRPDNYREISFSGKGFHVSCSWDSGRVTLSKDEDEYMAYNEGMTTHYATKTRAGARKLWIMIDKMGERAFSRMSGEDFLELLKKKRIAMQYVPTVWR